MKVYISGKITGLTRDIYLTKFANAEKKLKDMGYEVINPVALNDMLPVDTTWQQYMDVSLVLLKMCDAIYLLDGWEDSPGARVEYTFATKSDYKILHEVED